MRVSHIILFLNKKYLSPRGDIIIHTFEKETEKAIAIRRWRCYDEKRIQKLKTHEEDFLRQFPRAKPRFIFRGNCVSGRDEVFYLPKSQITIQNNKITLPRWLARKYGIDVLEEVGK